MVMDPSERTLLGTRFAASAGTHYAADAAAEVYRAGGNAADAAVAAAAAVAVTEPLMSSLGGGGFALVRVPAGGADELVGRDGAVTLPAPPPLTPRRKPVAPAPRAFSYCYDIL